jgi:hypothetical protein
MRVTEFRLLVIWKGRLCGISAVSLRVFCFLPSPLGMRWDATG